MRRMFKDVVGGNSKDAGHNIDEISGAHDQGETSAMPQPRQQCQASTPASAPIISAPGRVSILEAESKSRSASSGGVLERAETSRSAATPLALTRLSSQLTRSLTLGFIPRTPTGSPASLESVSPRSDVGLHLIHDVETPVADLILVHGLGGSWIKTWSWKHDPQIFWPSWLPDEEGLVGVRVFSFGYNANFRGATTNLGILDFAKDLLFKMSGYGAMKDVKIGQTPIIFVAHSMGGLVVKKAYVLGTLDDSYSEMISRVFGIIFLATPHRGSNYARTLNNILSASMITNAKLYVAELEADSTTLQNINEEFRLVCKPLRLVSFYESLKTQAGTHKILVVGRDSGALGYPSEFSSPMDADHHNVSKFSSTDDANYIALRDVIRDCVRKCSPSDSSMDAPKDQANETHRADAHEVSQTLTALLGIQEVIGQTKHPGMEGTCHWIQTRDYYDTWAWSSTDMLRVLWLTGLPGAGKSTLAQAIVNSLKGDEDSEDTHPGCQYHFFTFSDVAKRKVAYALRCIAFQLALQHEGFCQRLLLVYEKTGLRLEQQEAQVIWTRIFEGIIFKMDFHKPLYWVFDGLDESDAALSLVNYVFRARPKSPIRIFLTSRPASSLINLAQSGRDFLTHVPLTVRDTRDDVKLFIWTTLQDTIPTGAETRERIAQQMFAKASGSFVWVKLALKTLERAWHTEDDIRRALADVPQGMHGLFNRMADSIEDTKQDNPRNYALASRILAWATCSAESLTTAQLATALEPEFTKLQNLEATILDLCGLFITVADGKVLPIHETAKSFLLGAHLKHRQQAAAPLVDGPICHEHLAAVCLKYLSSERWRSILMGIPEDGTAGTKVISENRLTLLLSEQPFLSYAVSYWAYHVSRVDSESDQLLPLLHDFFDRHLLSWIHACVVLCGLRVVTRAAQYVKTYGRNCESKSLLGSTASLSWNDTNFFRLWAIDLNRIVGRFGRNLAEKPTSIYKIVPPLCPKGSMIYKTYASQGTLSLQGISSETWDDCLARLPIGEERTIYRVLSTVAYFVCLIAVGGEIIVCYTDTCEEARRMIHGEYVPHMTVNKSGSMLATAGIETFRVWELISGEQLYRIDRPESSLVMTIAFGSNDELFVGYDNCMVTSYDMEKGVVLSEFLAEEADDEDYHPCPRAMVLSPDVTRLAIVFRGRPVLIWDISSHDRRPVQCVRDGDMGKHSDDMWDQLDSIIWHPDGLSVFVLYQDTTLVWFFLTDDKIVENSETSAREMVISQDGSLLLTSDNAGTLSLWSLPGFQLVYRVPHEEFVRDLAFSPDSQRFYDVRGAICNIWEPDVLLRAGDDESEDLSATDTNDTVFSDPVLATDANARSQITTITRGPNDRYCVCGKDDGSMTIYSSHDGSKLRKAYSHANGAAVIALAWSLAGKYMASADDNGRVLTKKLEAKDEGKWAVFPCLDFRDQESVRQIIFHRGERLMLISFSTSDRVWSLKTKAEVWRRDRQQGLGLQLWTNHPTQKNLLLCMRPDKTTLHDWLPQGDQSSHEPGKATLSRALTGLSSGKSSPTSPRAAADTSTPRVRRVALSESRKCIVVEVLPGISAHTKLGNKALRLEVAYPETVQTSQTGASISRVLLKDIAGSVRRFLGCYKDHIVFLNHEYWVCTWPLGAPSSAAIKRHFFLPRDCISPSSLPLVTLLETGTIIFPKNGELAIVQNGLRL